LECSASEIKRFSTVFQRLLMILGLQTVVNPSIIDWGLSAQPGARASG
jgi:hypothetical protein